MSTQIPYKELKPKDASDIVWTTIVEAWENGLSDREAAFRASRYTQKPLSANEIKMWKKNDPKIAELCEMLKDDLKATAKMNAAKLLKQGDDKTTRWYLEHKCPEEFSTKSAVAFEGAAITLSLEEKEKALKELVEKFEDGE